MSTHPLLTLRTLLVVATMTSAVHAQATPYVPPGARVYRDIERLTTAGLIDTVIAGVRPYSEREIIRLLNEARRNLDRNPAMHEWARVTIDADLARYAPHALRGLDGAETQVSALRSPNRPAPKDENGTIGVPINPLAAYQLGQPLADHGVAATFETFHSADLGPHVALSLNPRASVLPDAGRTTGAAPVTLQSGGANLLFGNLMIDAGREYVLLGTAPTGGLLFSEQSPALDMARVANDRPAALPWIFGLLGPIRGTLSIADLGTQIPHPHAKLVTYQVAALPHPNFEFGLEVLDAMGGNGGLPATFERRAADALPFVTAILKKSNEFQFSNKMAGGDAKLRVPSLAGLEIYGEGVLDDFDPRRFRSSFLDDGGYIVGAAVTCVVACERFGLRAEYHQTGIRYYTHPDYPIEANQTLLGDPLGPRGLGGYLTLDGETGGGMRFSLQGAFEVRSGNLYGSSADSVNQSDFQFVQIAHRPAEKRARVLAGWSPTYRDARLTVDLNAGVERVHSFDFVPGANRWNALGQVTVAYWPTR